MMTMSLAWRMSLVATLLALTNAVTPPPPHNILFVMADDLLDVTVDEKLKGEFPNFESFAKDSIHYTNAMCQTPWCSPSRASMLSGMYFSSWSENSESRQIVHRTARDQRKELTNTRKKMNWHAFAKHNGYDVYSTGKIYHESMGDRKIMTDSVKVDQNIMESGKRRSAYGGFVKKEKQTADFRIKEAAIKFMRKHNKASRKGHQKPFFITVGFQRPHSSLILVDRPWTRLSSECTYATDLPELGRPNSSDTPELFYTAMQDCGNRHKVVMNEPLPVPWKGPALRCDDVRGPGEAQTERYVEATKQFRDLYMRCVRSVDHYFGELMKELKDLGIYNTTTVVFTSDHGWSNGEHGRWAKKNLDDASIRVPLFLKPPSGSVAFEGRVDDAPIPLLDIGRLMFNVSGVTQPFRSDYKGTGAAVTVLGSRNGVKRFGMTPVGMHDLERYENAYLMVSIRTIKFRYTVAYPTRKGRKNWANPVDFASGPVEEALYDATADPAQIHNLLANDKTLFASERQAMIQMMKTELGIDQAAKWK
ncbi:Ulvan-active sulfatase (Iduronate 2-sulfatase) (Polysaccharide utilization locus H protein P11) (PUL H protein P11) (Sulfatase family S1 subfamily 7 protein P11) (P11_S1_7) [Durusdinium trenchii]|uniref:Ulvan-active sulfatase (Iduronate 2-sulfatase) (Polysaccharide utilization locus H protein P11) (PUL H protein P11) (Sulfatase family S1 subfamily 7 protein P11) (P11_S1_7) n=1 Tax=Durusdinium trenchii TaxID=1381693 RepID=A0ABP0H6M7_9DINO